MNTNDIKENRLYGDLAHLWPLVSDPADYANEANYWRQVLKENIKKERGHIFELGVGGGNNLSHLTNDFDATASDLSAEIIKHSIKLNPTVDHHVGDMRTIRLNRKFDAVIIHDAICYLKTEDEIRETLATVSAHLDSGGVFVTAPDNFRETFVSHKVIHSTEHKNGVAFTMIEYLHDPDSADTEAETIMTYIIEENGQTTIELDRHITGLFSLDQWTGLIADAGFDVSKKDYPVHEDGRPGYLLVGIKK